MTCGLAGFEREVCELFCCHVPDEKRIKKVKKVDKNVRGYGNNVYLWGGILTKSSYKSQLNLTYECF